MLGPLLFIIYMNSIFSVGLSTLTKLILYADDIMPYKVINTQLDVIELQSDIDRIGCWVQSAGIKLNQEKKVYVDFKKAVTSYCLHITE